MNIATMLPGYFAKLNTRLRGGGRARSSDGGESPLRAELFSADQMEQHGRVLAASHRLAAGRGADQLLARLAANESALVEVSRQLTVAITESQRMTPAAEWLLDNFHLVEEQIRTAKRHLPRGLSLIHI